MRRIIQNGVIDYSDEGDQARQIGVKIDLDLFLQSLPEAHRRLCEALWSGETIADTSLAFGVAKNTLYRHRGLIQKAYKNWCK